MAVVSIRALDTKYAGRFFRSRLEARWAVFYDHIGVPWTYEPEGFALSDGTWYLPDFWLPGQDCYIEIKPTTPDDAAGEKCRLLSEVTGKDVFLFFGQPGYHIDGGYPSGQIDSDGAWAYGADGLWDNNYTWCVCQECGRLGIEFDGRSARLGCGCHGPDVDKAYTNDDLRLLRAYDIANSYRF